MVACRCGDVASHSIAVDGIHYLVFYSRLDATMTDLTFLPHQQEFIKAEGQHIYYYGGRGGGKTTALLHRLAAELYESDCEFSLIVSSRTTIEALKKTLIETGAEIRLCTDPHSLAVQWHDVPVRFLRCVVSSSPLPQWAHNYRGTLYIDDGRGIPFEMGKHMKVRQAIDRDYLSNVLPAEARNGCWIVVDGVPGKTYREEGQQ